MKPEVYAETVEIPMTFDVSSNVVPLTERRLRLGILIFVGIILAGVVLGIFIGSIGGFILCLGLVGIATYLFRMLYFKEAYYKRKYGELKAHGFVYNTNTIWDIYEIAPGFPICSFKNGSKAIFVTFDKDIVVGKPENNEYLHYEAIANAFQLISKKNIECMHIDYMDTVGKDGRLEPVIKQLLKTPNKQLSQLLSLVFEYQQYTMSKSYSSYDVYAFYYRYNDEDFRDDLETIIGAFMNANYIRYRLLGVSQLRELVKSIYNIEEFSVYNACDNVFKTDNMSKYIRVIYTECNGERTIINKTTEEREYEKAKKQRNKKPATVKKNIIDDTPVDMFDEQGVDNDFDDSTDEFIYLEENDIVNDFASDDTDYDINFSEESAKHYRRPQPKQYDLDEDTDLFNDDSMTVDDVGEFDDNEDSEEEIDLFG